MKFHFEISNQSTPNWDNEILKYDSPEICQTSFFGEYIQKSGGQPAYISIYENGDLIGNCLVNITRDRICTWSYGPMISTDRTTLQEEIIVQLFDFLRKNDIVAIENIKTQKHFNTNVSFDENEKIYSGIGESPYIDIRPGMDEILGSFDRSVRKNINKCLRNGIEVLISEDATLLEPYLEMLSTFRLSRSFDMPSFFPNTDTMRIFNTPLSSMGIALARYEGQYLAGMGFITFGSTMTELAMATSKDYESVKLPVNELIKVKAIEHYKDKGMQVYDLAGGKKDPTDPKKISILKYKLKFASNTASFGMIDRKILKSVWYFQATQRKIKNVFLKNR